MHAQRNPSIRSPDISATLAALTPLPLDAERVVPALRWLIDSGHGALPTPGRGHTLERWHTLATVAATDLSLLKLYEGHTDAVAILDELDEATADGTWGVWAADVPGVETRFDPAGEGTDGRLTGRKAWCSGVGGLDHALLTARTPDGQPVLVRVALQQSGITHDCGDWKAVGMAATRTGKIAFDGVRARRVGAPDAYLQRPGFWHGGAGIAACWYGAARAVAMTLRCSPRVQRDPHAQAHLGAVDARLFAARCALQAAAAAIDAAPAADARLLALRVRAIVEAAATETLERVGRALGAVPLCVDAAHAQRCADLATFVRQSHAESDLQTLGGLCAEDDASLQAAVVP